MKTSVRLFPWLPRILCILAILFISSFAADAFAPELSLWQQLTAFLIHLIPSYILLIILIIAWRWEFIGGIIFLVISLSLSPIVFMKNYQTNHSIWMSLGIILLITIPFVIVGVLFIISHRKSRQGRLLSRRLD